MSDTTKTVGLTLLALWFLHWFNRSAATVTARLTSSMPDAFADGLLPSQAAQPQAVNTNQDHYGFTIGDMAAIAAGLAPKDCTGGGAGGCGCGGGGPRGQWVRTSGGGCQFNPNGTGPNECLPPGPGDYSQYPAEYPIY